MYSYYHLVDFGRFFLGGRERNQQVDIEFSHVMEEAQRADLSATWLFLTVWKKKMLIYSGIC